MPEKEATSKTCVSIVKEKTCLSIVEEKEEKTSGRRNTMVKDTKVKDTIVKDTKVKDTMVKDTIVKDTIVKDTMVKGVEGSSVTTLLLGGNDEKKGHETGK